MTLRNLYLAATPEDAYFIARDRVISTASTEVELVARRSGCPNGVAVEVRVPEDELRRFEPGRFLADKLVAEQGITRAFQPWHLDVDDDPSARWKAYFQPESITLRNLVGADTPGTLRFSERILVQVAGTGLGLQPVQQTYDLEHARAIHERLFRDVYPWAGEPRTVNMHRPGGPAFTPFDQINDAWAALAEEARQVNHLANADRSDFVHAASTIYNEANTIHAFREGNGRTQRVWMSDVARHAGYKLNWLAVQGDTNDLASARAREGDIKPMQEMFDLIASPLITEEPEQLDASTIRSDVRQAIQRSMSDVVAQALQADPANTATTSPGRTPGNSRDPQGAKRYR